MRIKNRQGGISYICECGHDLKEHFMVKRTRIKVCLGWITGEGVYCPCKKFKSSKPNPTSKTYRRRHEPKRVELGPGDVKPGDLIRAADVPEVMSVVVAVWPNGIRFIDGHGICSRDWKDLVGSIEIDRCDGNGFVPCWKEGVTT